MHFAQSSHSQELTHRLFGFYSRVEALQRFEMTDWLAKVEILRSPWSPIFRVLRHLTVIHMPCWIKWVTGDRHR